MKDVLFIIETLEGGGAEKSLIQLLKQFDYTRYKLTLCIVFNSGIYFGEIPKGVKIVYLYKKENSYYRKSNRYYKKHNISWFLAFQIRKKTKRHYDVIISFLEGRSLLFHNFIRTRADKNISWIHCDLFNFHWTIPSAFNNREQELNCYKNMDEIVFVSRNAMENFANLYQIDTPQRCVYNVIDVDEIRQLAGELVLPHNSMTITAIGSLSEVKGFDRLIRVAKKFKDDGYSLLFQIIGTGSKEKELVELRNKLGLQEDFLFLGFKRPPYPYLKASDILVSTSLAEGFSLVICEAFALGIPIVATKTAGAIELLDGGQFGVLTEQDDQSIFDGIKALIDDTDLMSKYQNLSLNRAESFRVEEVMRQIYDLI